MERSQRIVYSTNNNKSVGSGVGSNVVTKKAPEFDLNLDNYTLVELCNLFKLSPVFSEQDLKDAKRVVYQMHPDKSGLPSDFFRFFQKAHKTLEDVLSFSQRRQGDKPSAGRERTLELENKEVLNLQYQERLQEYSSTNLVNSAGGGGEIVSGRVPTTSNAKEFNRDFNRAFEEANSNQNGLLNPQNGYNSWFKQRETEEEKEMNQSKQADAAKLNYMKEKYRNQQLSIYQEPMEYCSSSVGTSLDGDIEANGLESVGIGGGGNFSSGMFDSLQYQDLKQAYTQSVIPVTEADFDAREKYKNINELQQARSRQSLNPMNEREAREMLERRQKKDQELANSRAFRLAQEVEKGMKQNQQFDRMFLQIKN